MSTLIVGESPCRVPRILDVMSRTAGSFFVFRLNWEEFAKRLGVPEKNILELSNDLKLKVISLKGLMIELLYIWKRNCGDDATLEALCQALIDSHAKDIAVKLKAEFEETLKVHVPVRATTEVRVEGQCTNISDAGTPTYFRMRMNLPLDPIQILHKLEIPDLYESTAPLADFIKNVMDQLDQQELKVLEGLSFKWLFPSNLAEILNVECDYDGDQARQLIPLEHNRVLWFTAAKGVLNSKLNEQQMQRILAYVFECEERQYEEEELEGMHEEEDEEMNDDEEEKNEEEDDEDNEHVDDEDEDDEDEDDEDEDDEDEDDEDEDDEDEDDEERDVTIPTEEKKNYMFKRQQLVEFMDWFVGNGYELRLNFQIDWLDQYMDACLNSNAFNLTSHLFYMPTTPVYWLPGILHTLVKHTMSLNSSKLQERVYLVLNTIKENPGSVNILNENNRPPLLMNKIHVELVHILMNAGADIDAVDQEGCNFVHIAAKHLPLGQFQHMVRHLAHHHLTYLLSCTDSKDRTPLFYLVRYSNPDPIVLHVFKSAGANFNATDKFGLTLLLLAVKNNRSIETLQALVAYGANWNWKDVNNSHLLHHAAWWGNLEAVKYFMGFGLDVNSQDVDLRTPLMYAVINNKKVCNMEVIKFLIDNKANVNAIDTDGNSVLSLAVIYNRSVDILRVLVDRGADWKVKDDNNSSLLHRAAYEGNFEIVKYFVGLGLDVNSRDNDLQTPLIFALVNEKQSNIKVIKFLLENNADVDASNNNGENALHFAEKLNQKDIYGLLISKSASISLSNCIKRMRARKV